MSTMKPDYFIAHNGLPSILLARSRLPITKTTTKPFDRVAQQIHPPDRNKRLSGANQQAHVMYCDSEKNIRNRAIKESLRTSKTTKDLINTRIVKSASSRLQRNQQTQTLSAAPKCASEDNSECNRNVKRCSTPSSTSCRDNKLAYQRKYDNKIFRHDLPDRIVLPPLPI